jgi:hypothetical protein
MQFEKRYEWIEYPAENPGEFIDWDESYAGFKMRILVNPSGSEVRNETALHIDSAGPDLEKQDAYWQYIAPRITEWNLQVQAGNGKPKDVPAPADDWSVLLDLPFEVQMWVRETVHWAHRPKARMLLQGKHGTTASTQPTALRPAS